MAATAALLWLRYKPYTGADVLATWLAQNPDADAVVLRCQCGHNIEIPRETAQRAIMGAE
jgi:hypothetical protein